MGNRFPFSKCSPHTKSISIACTCLNAVSQDLPQIYQIRNSQVTPSCLCLKSFLVMLMHTQVLCTVICLCDKSKMMDTGTLPGFPTSSPTMPNPPLSFFARLVLQVFSLINQVETQKDNMCRGIFSPREFVGKRDRKTELLEEQRSLRSL